MPFVQLIGFQTERVDEFDAAAADWVRESEGWRSASRSVRTEDRDRPGNYVQIVEFPSYEAAMENSGRPETSRLAERLASLCDQPPTFRNLDVRQIEAL